MTVTDQTLNKFDLTRSLVIPTSADCPIFWQNVVRAIGDNAYTKEDAVIYFKRTFNARYVEHEHEQFGYIEFENTEAMLEFIIKWS